MARNMDIKVEIIAPVVEEFASPDTADVVWTDTIQPVAEDGQPVLEAFYAPESHAGDDSVSLEIPATDVSADTDWLDFAESGLESVDLNDLLDAGSVSAELETIAILGENASDETQSTEAKEPRSEASDWPEVAHLSEDFLFPQVTIVIDADSETDSVAF
ncbi:MAG: hypothetical protein MPJ78_09275 [Hyphomicrobiaceae bacterium]|nr:hypothetical protein [Hyphomicrobiaceae bacterium]